MKTNPIMLLVIAIAMPSLLFFISCKKDYQQKNDRTLNAGILGTGCLDASPATDSTIAGVINTDLYLSNARRYKLSGLVYVTAGHTITIQHGTRILGLAGVGSAPGGGLVICRGAKINAVGTPDCPIVFTSYRYDDNTVTDAQKSGDWAGVIILGRARINNPIPLPLGSDSAIVEGIPTGAPASIYYGGPNDADNSGILKYVRIEYAGYELSLDNEINGLTLAGVGSATTIDFVAVTAAKDDAFQWFGGTVNSSHLIAINALDDLFDTENGYTGSITYALGLADANRADKSESNGIESGNDTAGSIAPPITHPKFSFLTIIGVSTGANASNINRPPSGVGRYGRGAHLRLNTEFEIDKSIFMGYNFGISLDSLRGSTPAKYRAGISKLSNSFAHGFGTTTITTAGAVPFATEKAGQAASGTAFSTTTWFYSKAIAGAGASMGVKNANPNAGVWIAVPFGGPYTAVGTAASAGSQINTWALGTTPTKWTQVRW